MGRNSHYFKGKEENALRAKELYEKIENDEQLMGTTSYSVDHSFIYSPEDKEQLSIRDERYYTYKKPIIEIADMNTAMAIWNEKSYEVVAGINRIVAALNFASYKNPGGMFLKGSMAQEESLCHSSNLYNILSRFPEYYSLNRKNLNNSLYCDVAIFSPMVLFFGSNTVHPCDIITCAAPNRYAAQRYNKVSDEENWYALYNRIEFVLDIANKQGVDVLILGAYGCGVFGQNPYEVAAIFKYLLENKKYCFEKVIFAIPKGTRADNYTPFYQVFEDPNFKTKNPFIKHLLKL